MTRGRGKGRSLTPAGALPCAADVEMVVYRLEEAGATLLALKNHGAPYRTPRGHLTSAARVMRMEEALAWVELIPRERMRVRQVVRARALVSPSSERHLHGWAQVAHTLGRTEGEVQAMHREGIETIVAVLQALARPKGSADAGQP